VDFSSHWIAKEEDYSIERATEVAINELVSSAKMTNFWTYCGVWIVAPFARMLAPVVDSKSIMFASPGVFVGED
jgi:hypothetical protein